MTKKITAVFLALCIAVLTLASCGTGTTATDSTKAASAAQTSEGSSASDSADWDKIVASGKLVVGITIFSPMDYYVDENGDKDNDDNITGFDADVARAVCDKLGLKAHFQVINWDTKEVELKSGSIDCIWNGLTVNPELAMDFSDSYMTNSQIFVVKSANKDKYTSIDSFAAANLVAESGSAGESVIKDSDVLKNAKYSGLSDMQAALLEVKSGTADAAVVDYIMALGSLGLDTSFSDLTIVPGLKLSSEEYAVGFRQGAGETIDKVNGALSALRADGTLKTIAAKYGIQDALL